jgi:predicted ATPase/class 3 adenylate cyclase
LDVGEWLRGLGLGEYAGKFRDHKIDEDVLVDLADGDLEKLGLPLGDRKRLLKAIAGRLAGREQARVAAVARELPPKPSPRADSAERRPITVLFCDLVGSTALASRLDAEDWRSLVNAYLDEASAAVTGLGGHVLKRLGDGLMVLFGYPIAQENDAERAVRAALAIQRALGEMNAKNAVKGASELSARIGLESGPVVMEAAGEVFGDAPNVAARVQGLAQPGSVLVTMNVQRQIAGLFVVEERGPSELKGLHQPVELFRIIRASGAGRRGHARSLTPFVGRDEELDLLTRRWESVRAGQGQFVLIVGEPGLGKSRLIEEFRARRGATPHTWVEWSASQLLQNTPLHPIAEWGRLRFGDSDISAEERLAELESALKQVKIDPEEAVPLIAPLLDMPLPQGRAPQLPPEEMRRRQLAALVGWIMAGSRSQAIVLAFEDLQWADPTSIDLMRALAERGAQSPLFIVATARPEFRAPWGMRSHHSVVSLAPLTHTEVVRMIGELAARHALSKDVVKGVSERAGGVPLFVEEVTRLIMERREQPGAQAIPPTLQQSLAARLDRLGEAREIAQIGAVLGRDFSYALLRAVAWGTPVAAAEGPGQAGLSEHGYSDLALQLALDRLAEADILFVEGIPPQSNYRFKHALIQDAAYESLLKSRRQTLHQRAAEILVGQPERATAEPEVIAHHFARAGLDDLAIEWWGKAGDQALRRSAFQEAIAHLGKAIKTAEWAMGTTPTTSGQYAKLQTDYAKAVMWSKGFAAEETDAALARAGELAAQAESNAERYTIFYAQWLRTFIRGELTSAHQMAESFLREADAEGRGMEAVRARANLGMTCICQGELAAAQSCLQRALADHSPEWDIDSRRVFGSDNRIVATDYLAMLTWLLGNVQYARSLIEQAVREGQQSGHLATITHTYNYRTMLETLRDDPAATLRAAGASVEIARKYNAAFFEAFGKVFLSWARARHFNPAAGAAELRQVVAAYLERGNGINAPLLYGLIAQLEAIAGRIEDAFAALDAGLSLAKETGEHWTDPLLFHRKGEILLKRDPADLVAAEEAFRTAVEIAKQQGSRSFGLRTALVLAKLYQSAGRHAEACTVLTPALEGCAPTPEMPEIADAQALLDRLAHGAEGMT